MIEQVLDAEERRYAVRPDRSASFQEWTKLEEERLHAILRYWVEDKFDITNTGELDAKVADLLNTFRN